MRKIIHVDMDCFYAAVEVKKNPRLRGQPLGIGGPAQSRSVLCTASYEARKFGVRAAMPSSQAVRLCPQLILVPPDFDSYKKESHAVRKIFERFTELIEPLSLDEAYLDVTDCKQFDGSATRIAFEIRKMIHQELQLTASAGISSNKFLAKIASDWNKPNGQFVVRPQDVDEFVKPLPIEKIFGVGAVTAQKMHKLGLRTCQDIQNQKIETLIEWFGKRGIELYNYSRGVDEREVDTSSERKSLSVEQTFNQDLLTLENCLEKIPELYSDWLIRLEKSGAKNKIKNSFIKIKCQDFKKLFQSAWIKREEAVRLIGLGTHLHAANSNLSKTQLQFAI